MQRHPTGHMHIMKFCESCSVKILMAFQIVLLFCLARAEILTDYFYVMKANGASSSSIRSYRLEIARSAMNGFAMCSRETQCLGVWVEPIDTRKVRCHFVNSSLSETEPRKYDFWRKVGEVVYFFVLSIWYWILFGVDTSCLILLLCQIIKTVFIRFSSEITS